MLRTKRTWAWPFCEPVQSIALVAPTDRADRLDRFGADGLPILNVWDTFKKFADVHVEQAA